MRRVLVVDDDQDMRDLIGLMLRRAGYTTVAVESPFLALDVATTEAFDVAVLDWSMPGMNGGELCTRMRESPDIPDTPIMILTAHADQETRDRAFASGADRFMTKPFTLAELSGAVAALIGSRT
ncbi:response regulator [Nocardioides oleivorans]|uniref:Response regulator n=1 Tax=Nocardioides oleivorans TaxID=273676 RepID=A0A4Q2RWR1_9ACTN|nr:response regulator [Nocardioides oleivorans]RYB93640.1 response regulator [Nocardioides oleivorans]